MYNWILSFQTIMIEGADENDVTTVRDQSSYSTQCSDNSRRSLIRQSTDETIPEPIAENKGKCRTFNWRLSDTNKNNNNMHII